MTEIKNLKDIKSVKMEDGSITINHNIYVKALYKENKKITEQVIKQSCWAVCYIDLDEENVLKEDQVDLTKVEHIMQESVIDIINNDSYSDSIQTIVDKNHSTKEDNNFKDLQIFKKKPPKGESPKLSDEVCFMPCTDLQKKSSKESHDYEIVHDHILRCDFELRENILVCIMYIKTTKNGESYKLETANIDTKNIYTRHISNVEQCVHVGMFFDGTNNNLHTIMARKLYEAFMLRSPDVKIDEENMTNEKKIDIKNKAKKANKIKFKGFVNHQFALLDAYLTNTIANPNENDPTGLPFLERIFRGLEFNDIVEIYNHCLLLIEDGFSILTKPEDKGNTDNGKHGDSDNDKSRYTNEETNVSLMYRSYKSTCQDTALIVEDKSKKEDKSQKPKKETKHIRKFYFTGRNSSTSNELRDLVKKKGNIKKAQASYATEAGAEGLGPQGERAKVKQAIIRLSQVINDEVNVNINKNIHITLDLFGFSAGATEARFFLNEIVKGANGELCNLPSSCENVNIIINNDEYNHQHNFLLFYQLKKLNSFINYHDDNTVTYTNYCVLGDGRKRKLLFHPDSQTSTHTVILSYSKSALDKNPTHRDAKELLTIKITLNFLGIFDTVSSIAVESKQNVVMGTAHKKFLLDGFNLLNSCGLPYEINIHPNSVKQAVHITASDEMRDNFRLNSLVSLNIFDKATEDKSKKKHREDEISFVKDDNEAFILHYNKKSKEVYTTDDNPNEYNTPKSYEPVYVLNPYNIDIQEREEGHEDLDLILNNASPYSTRQANKLQLPTTFLDQSNIEEFTMRGVHADIGGGYPAIASEIPKAGVSYFKDDLNDLDFLLFETVKKQVKKKQDVKNLYSPYFGTYNEDWLYTYQIDNNFDKDAAFLARNIMGDLSNVYLKCMYIKAKKHNVPFDYTNLYYKHGVKAIVNRDSATHETFKTSFQASKLQAEEGENFDPFITHGISSHIGWYDKKAYINKVLYKSYFHRKIQDIAERTTHNGLVLIDQRISHVVAYEDNTFTLRVDHRLKNRSYTEPSNKNSTHGILLIDEEVYQILKNTCLPARDVGSDRDKDKNYSIDSLTYSLKVISPIISNDKNITNVKIDLETLLKENDVTKPAPNKIDEYNSNEYNSSFCLTQEQANSVSLPPVKGEKIKISKDKKITPIYNLERLLKNLYIHHSQDNYSSLYHEFVHVNNYTNTGKNVFMADSLLLEAYKKKWQDKYKIQLDSVLCVRMVYYNDIARAYFVRNINTLKMNNNLYLNNKGYQKWNGEINHSAKDIKQPGIDTTTLLKHVIHDSAENADQPRPEPFDNLHDTTLIEAYREINGIKKGTTGMAGMAGMAGPTVTTNTTNK